MRDDPEWEIVRHQVSISGRVTAADGRPLAGVRVSLSVTPQAFAPRLRGAIGAAGPRWDSLEERPDRVLSRHDGIYYFLDLPAGGYTLAATAPQTGAGGENSVAVAWDKEGKVKAAVADLRLAAQ